MNKGKVFLSDGFLRPFIAENHIQIGSKEKSLKDLNEIKVKIIEQTNFVFWGIKVFEKEGLPENKAYLVNAVGQIIQTFNL